MEDAINDKVINGVALCNPMDNFDREKGRKLSLTRALKTWGLEKADRTIIWKAYASMCNKSW